MNKQTKEELLANLYNLKSNEGWNALVKVLNLQVEVLEKQLLEGNDTETMQDVQILRNKIKMYKDFIKSLDIMINGLADNTKKIDLDPFF